MTALLALLFAIMLAFPSSEWTRAYSVSTCENVVADPSLSIIDTNGLVSAGVGMVQAHWHGAVPGDVFGQVRQMRDIWSLTESWTEWSCQP